MAKKIITRIGIYFAVFFLIFNIFLCICEKTKLNKKKSYIPEKNVTYIVKEYNGAVAVYASGTNNTGLPIKITKILTKDLPHSDQTMLKAGIEAANSRELTELLEDLGF